MKQLSALLLLVACSFQVSASTYWRQVVPGTVVAKGEQGLQPAKYSMYYIDIVALKSTLATVSDNREEAIVIELPSPDGSMQPFKIWQTPVMEQPLAARYSEIKTFTGVAANNPAMSIKLDYTTYGFHAMVLNGSNSYFIDPYSNEEDRYYLCYYKRDYKRSIGELMECQVGSADEAGPAGEPLHLTPNGLPATQLKTNGLIHKTYRLALSCTGEYSEAVAGPNPTKANVLSKMIVTLNRVNGVFEKELAVTMQLIGNNDTLIFLNGVTDPFTNNNGPAMLAENQTVVDDRVGQLNYDIGHVFSTGGGGIADIDAVCTMDKARGVTGQPNPVGDAFDLDFVAHEIGHQFGATHTFNSNAGFCSGNISSMSAYEPGSGSTLMGYAGLCNGNNIEQHSDAYFHAISLDQIEEFIAGIGGTCATVVASGNTPAVVPPFSAEYYIPYLTPFELTAPQVTDATADVITYCWEQWNRGDIGQSFAQTRRFGPIFRSFPPDTSRTRIFPTLPRLLKNETLYLGEKLPDTARELTFKLTVRDEFNNLGAFNFPDDSIQLHVVYTGTPFQVTLPNTASEYWQSGTMQTVTWDVGGSDQAPINCSNVDIMLSLDSGYTYPVILAANTPNDGTEQIMVPAGLVNYSARVKVKGVNNVFFDISNQNFTIDQFPVSVANVNTESDIKIYPVPASDMLHIEVKDNHSYDGVVTDAVGKIVWKGTISKETSLNVNEWSGGVYFLRLADETTGEQIAKTFSVQ